MIVSSFVGVSLWALVGTAIGAIPERDKLVQDFNSDLRSMAPMDTSFDRDLLTKKSILEVDWDQDFVIFHDANNKPQAYSSVPYHYGYVDAPRQSGHVNQPLLDSVHRNKILDLADEPQTEGAIKLYADGNGQSQIKHLGARSLNATWRWDVTLPELADGMVVALWSYGGPGYLDPDGYQFEFDIELMSGGVKGPRIEANFHDGMGPGINFGTLKTDWGGQRVLFEIEQSISEGYCEIRANGAVVGRITEKAVKAKRRQWPTKPMFSVTNLWIASTAPTQSGKYLRAWAGTPDLEMDPRTMIVHGYEHNEIES